MLHHDQRCPCDGRPRQDPLARPRPRQRDECGPRRRRLPPHRARAPCCSASRCWGTPGLNRRLQRQGLRDLLPPGIASRRSKARFTQVWLRTVERHLLDASWPDTLVLRNGGSTSPRHAPRCSTRALESRHPRARDRSSSCGACPGRVGAPGPPAHRRARAVIGHHQPSGNRHGKLG